MVALLLLCSELKRLLLLSSVSISSMNIMHGLWFFAS